MGVGEGVPEKGGMFYMLPPLLRPSASGKNIKQNQINCWEMQGNSGKQRGEGVPGFIEACQN